MHFMQITFAPEKDQLLTLNGSCLLRYVGINVQKQDFNHCIDYKLAFQLDEWKIAVNAFCMRASFIYLLAIGLESDSH